MSESIVFDETGNNLACSQENLNFLAKLQHKIN